MYILFTSVLLYFVTYFLFHTWIIVRWIVYERCLRNANIMAKSQLLESTPTACPSAWAADRPNKKRHEYYSGLKEKFKPYITWNKLLSVPSLLVGVNTKTISLLTTDVKTRRLIGGNRETMEEVLKTLKLMPKYFPVEIMPCGTSCWEPRTQKNLWPAIF